MIAGMTQPIEGAPPSVVANLADIARFNAAQHRDSPATIFQGRTISYGQLDDQATRIANGLRQLGIERGGRVGVIDKNRPEIFEIMFGVAKAGGVLVSLNWRLAKPELHAIIADSQMSVLFAGGAFHRIVAEIIDEHDLAVMLIDLGDDSDAFRQGWSGQFDTVDRGPDLDSDDVCMQLYTSGTTGRPKGVQITHRAIMTLIENTVLAWRFREPGIVSLLVLPLFHIGGINWALMNFRSGRPIVLLSDFSEEQVFDCIERYRITSLNFVPSIIVRLMHYRECSSHDLSSLRIVVYGGSPMSAEMLRRARALFDCDFVQTYAMTETTGQITAVLPGELDMLPPEKLATCGRAFADATIRIVDAQGADIPAGDVGEIIIASAQNTIGYWNNPEETARLIRDGWLYTGDAGFLDDDGYLFVCDRIKDVVITGGENVYPAEVENAIFKHPAVANVAVIGVPDPQWGEAIKAFVILKPGETANAEDLARHCRSHIAGYKVPRLYAFVDTLPSSSVGKVLKYELKAQAAQSQASED